MILDKDGMPTNLGMFAITAAAAILLLALDTIIDWLVILGAFLVNIIPDGFAGEDSSLGLFVTMFLIWMFCLIVGLMVKQAVVEARKYRDRAPS